MIKVDDKTCIGCGACTYIDEDTFKMNDKGVSTAVTQEITDKVKEAAAACPVGAISVDEQEAASVSEEMPKAA